MVQRRHDSVEEIKDGLRDCISELASNISDRYIIFDRKTRQEVEPRFSNLMEQISDSEWYEHEIIELLKRDEDDSIELMTQLVTELEDTPEACACEERNTETVPQIVASGRSILGVLSMLCPWTATSRTD